MPPARAITGIAILAIAAGAAGCNAAPSTSGSGSAAASAAANLPALTLTNVTTETAAARGATIGPDGGTITATGSNGATYTLTFPEDAVARPTRIGVYPVSSLANLPAGTSLTAGVQLTPDGLSLHAPATLAISVPAGVNTAALKGVAWTGDGVRGHTRLATVDGQTASLAVLHFSGAGLTPDDLLLTELCGASDWDCQTDRFEADLLDASIQQARRSALLNTLKSFYRDTVAPSLRESTSAAAARPVPESAKIDEGADELPYRAWLHAIADAGHLLGDTAFTVSPEVDQSKALAIPFLRAWYEALNEACALHPDDPNTALDWAAVAVAVHGSAGQWGIATVANDLDYESLLDELCVQLVIDPDRSFSAAKPGEKGTVDGSVGITIATQPIAAGAIPIQVDVGLTGSDGHVIKQVDADGHFTVDLAWPDGVDPVQIDVRANALYVLDGHQLLTDVARFDRITKGSKAQRILFASDRGADHNQQLWVMNEDGTNPVQLTHEAPGRPPQGAVFSPDGTKIAFVSPRGGGNLQIWLMNADGSEPSGLTLAEEGPSTFPTWSPDGKQLAFSGVPQGKPARLFVLDVATGAIRQLTDPSSGADYSPAWSPDGSRIAFTSTRTGSNQLYTVDPGSGAVTPITSGDATRQSLNPAWSPDSKRIVFVHLEQGSYAIQTMHLDGSGLALVYPGMTGTTYPAWSPDGKRIAFTLPVASTGGGEAVTVAAIFTVDVDGANLRQLTPSDSSSLFPTWSR